MARVFRLEDQPKVIITKGRSRYDPHTDIIYIPEYDPNRIIWAHEMGHRTGVLKGEIKKTIVTRKDEIEAEITAWKYAANNLRERGLWDEYAKSRVRLGLSGHGIAWDNYKKMDEIVNSL